MEAPSSASSAGPSVAFDAQTAATRLFSPTIVPVHRSAHALEMSWRVVEVIQAGLKASGIDDRAVLAKYGLTRDEARSEQRISHDVAISLLLECVRVTSDP